MIRAGRFLLASLAGVVLGQLGPLNSAAAETAPQWSPGHRTTKSPGPTVTADDDAVNVDGVYGRLDGDIALALALGAELESSGQRGLLHASAHYYWMAGLTASYREALGAARQEVSVTRIGSLGVDMRPLFIPRWSYGWQSGPAIWDLFLDSISIAAGAYFAKSSVIDRSRRRGFEASAGAGIPLFARAAGPWLLARYVTRWPEAGSPEGSVWLLLGWHFLTSSGLTQATANMH